MSEQTIAEKLEADMRKLEAGLAYEHAVSLIESSCTRVDDPTPAAVTNVYDLGDVDPEAADSVKEAADYLDWRGLLERGISDQNHVTILDECEAKQ